MSNVEFYRGFENNLPSNKNSDTFYITSDTGKMYLGDRRIGVPLEDGIGENSIQQEDCTALIKKSIAVGNKTFAGSKAFTIKSVEDTGNGTGKYTLSSVTGLTEDMRYVSVLSTANYVGGKITNIEGNTITVDGYIHYTLNGSSNNVANANIYNYLMIVDHPELGDIEVGFHAAAFGNEVEVYAVDSFGAGRGVKVLGKFGAGFGQNNEVGHGCLGGGTGNKFRGSGNLGGGTNNTVDSNGNIIGGTRHTLSLVRSEKGTAAGNHIVGGGYHKVIAGYNLVSGGGSAACRESFDSSVNTSTYCGNNVQGDANVVGGASHYVAGTQDAIFGFGHSVDTSGWRVFAAGSMHKIKGGLSAALGQGHVANGRANMLFGESHSSEYARTVAGGIGHVATADDQTIFGKYAKPSSDALFTIGNGESKTAPRNLFEIKLNGSMSVGLENYASGEANIITGTANQITGNHNGIVGCYNAIEGSHNFVACGGEFAARTAFDSPVDIVNYGGNRVKGIHNAVVGTNHYVGSDQNLVSGFGNSVQEIAWRTLVSGAYNSLGNESGLSVVTGGYSKINGRANCITGERHESNYNYVTVGGLNNKAAASYQTIFGRYNSENPAALFIIGNGVGPDGVDITADPIGNTDNSQVSRKNAFEVIYNQGEPAIKIGSAVLSETGLDTLYYDTMVALRTMTTSDNFIIVPSYYEDSGTWANSNAKVVVFPAGLLVIESSACEACRNLTSIRIPGKVHTIGASAFEGCTGLTEITIPDSVTSVGSYAFWGCTELMNVKLSNNISEIPQGAFLDCSKLTNIKIPEGVIRIGKYAFESCSNLQWIVLPKSLKYVGDCAFYLPNSEMDIKVFYEGTPDDWPFIDIEEIEVGNPALIQADRAYYSESKPLNDMGLTWWHYVDGKPEFWYFT